MRRLLSLLASLGTLALVVLACGGQQDAAPCEVVATSYDQSCTADSDCALVPPGGNACDPCGVSPGVAGAAYFFCDLATVNKAVSARYLEDLAAGREKSGTACPSSCPISPAPKCQAGRCVIPAAGGDGGVSK